MKLYYSIILLFVFAILIIPQIGQSTLTGFPYRIDMNVWVISGTTESDFQLNVTINSTNKPNNFNFTNECNGRMLLRNDTSENNLSYYILDCDDDFINFIVKTDFNISTNAHKISLYHGKLDSESRSNPNTTYLLYDDFNDESFNNSKWDDVSYNGFVFEENNTLKINCSGGSGERGIVKSADNLTSNAIIEYSVRGLFADHRDSIDVFYRWNGSLIDNWKDRSNLKAQVYLPSNLNVLYENAQNGTTNNNDVSITPDINFHYNIFRTNGTNITYINNLTTTKLYNTVTFQDLKDRSGYLGLASRECGPGHNDQATIFDWISVSKGYSELPVYNFTVPTFLKNCSDSGVRTLLFSFYNETNLSQLNGSMEIVLSIDSFGEIQEHNFTFSDNKTQEICLDLGKTYTANASINYIVDDMVLRNYFLVNTELSGNVTEVKLYGLDSSLGQQTEITVKDSAGNLIEGVIIYFQRNYLGENLYRTVAMARSDYIGVTSVFLAPDPVWYKYILVKDGVVLRSIGPSLLTTTDLVLQTSPSTVETLYSYTKHISYNCGYSSVAKFVSCEYVDLRDNIDTACLKIQESGILSLIDFNESCLDSVSGTITLNISELADQNKTARYIFYAIINSNNYTVTIDNVEFYSAPVYGLFGIFLTAIIVMFAGFLAFWRPEGAIIGGTIGIVASHVIGFIKISEIALGSLVFVAIILIVLASRRG